MTDSAAGRSLLPGAPVVGMVGAGQLARMTAQAAIGLGVGFRVLADAPEESAAQVCAGTELGDYRSRDDLLRFAAGCDVVTFDHEHVPGDHLAALERAALERGSAVVRPGSAALALTQDKLEMRERLTGFGIACPRFAPVTGLADVQEFAAGSWPVVLKTVTGGYDGKGVWVCESAAEAAAVLAHPGLTFMVEEYVPFARELAILIARSPHNQGAAYPVVQTVQRDGICREVLAPAPDLPPGRAAQATELALRLAERLGVTGLLAVELFETELASGEPGLLVNELAMRPHNTGHWTIEGARTSQFEQHLRAVLDLPLGSPALAAPRAAMANVLGGDGGDIYDRYIHVMAGDPAVKIHMYGKSVRPGRKIGHVTVTGDAESWELADRARRAASYLRWGTEDGT